VQVHLGHTERKKIVAPTSDCNITFKVVYNAKNIIRMTVEGEFLVIYTPLMTLQKPLLET